MKKYIGKLLAFTLLLLAILLPVNMWIDPYNVFHYENPVDNGVEPNKNFIKTKYILRHPDAFDSLVFGSSRAGFIDVTQLPDGRWYNMCYSEAVPAEYLNTLRVLIRGGVVLKRILVTVDDISCFVDPKLHENMLYRVPYPTGGPVSWLEFYAKYCDFITTCDALSVIREHESGSGDPDFAKRFRESGSERLDLSAGFDGTDGSGNEMSGYRADYYELRLDEVLTELRELRELCEANGIELIVVTNPLYYKTFETACENGYLKFLSGLADVTDYVNFSGISNVTTTPSNYYETSHYTPYVGWAMTEITFRGFQDEFLRKQGFGFFVTAENKEELLAILTEELKEAGVAYDL